MSAQRRKLERLKRLERVRAVARHDAAARAARAEDVFAQIVALDERTHALARRYEPSRECSDAFSLRQLGGFVSALRSIGDETARQIDTARNDADARQLELAQAERRRTVVEDRARDVRKALDRRPNGDAPTAARRTGTVLD